MLLKHSNLSLEVPIGAELLPDATKLATDFAIEAPVVTSELELLALFIHYCSTRSDDIALALFDHLSGDFLGSRDVYLAIQELSLGEEQARIVLKGYYSVWSLTEHHGSLCIPPTLPALFSDPSVCLMAMFGGQSGTGDYVAEARWLVDVFRPLVGSYFDRMSAFLSDESRDPRISRLYEYGMDVAMWCADAAKQPQISYLLKPSVAIPVTGLIQLMHLMILYKTLGISPGDLTKYFKVAVGHSQGTVAAALLASVTDEDSFYSLSEKALGILMLVGAYPELEYPVAEVDVEDIMESISREGHPSPMVSIRDLSRNQLDRFISEFNENATDLNAQVFLSLINTHDQFVVSGEADSLAMFVRWIRSKCAQPGEDQSRIPFSKRKPAVKMTYLTISRPYHCALLWPVIDSQLAHAVEKGWSFAAADMSIEIRASNDGHDIRQELDLTRHLFECTCALVVDFPVAIGMPTFTHIVDISPGGFSVFGTMAYANVEGRGIPVISTGVLTASNSPLGIKAELFKQNMADVLNVPNWQEQFAPRLVCTAHDHRLHLDTPMHRVLGQPPLMVAGMTPTSNERFVAAISNAGFHCELAGGGILNEQMLKCKFDDLIRETAPGQAITLNCVYFNQRLWNFQYAEVLCLRREGYPIAGICIGAGVPSLEVANEIIRNFRDVGIQHVAFKPGNATAIRQVVQIAQANPNFPVILQWTGGRGGGHHSCEDFHEPLLETYSAIRSYSNIVLVIGSGFGDAESTLPYLTGDWSVDFGRAPMPVDGFLFASRVMVAKEAGTSTAAKELIVQSSGLTDYEWEQTYSGEHGGTITIFSEYGELMHVIATRSAVFIKELYEAILSKPRDQQPALLNAKKDYYIQRLNADYMRPWFGKKADESICDLDDMTYLEVIGRLAELLYVKHQQRWIDPSYLDLFVRFTTRIENRFTSTSVNCELQALCEVDDPNGFVHHLATKYPGITAEPVSSEDIQYFVSICKRKGLKPVPFIPQFDEGFSVWLLKDTVWQSEDIDAVIDQDIQRTFILHGPVSARYSTKVNEPVKEILDGIYSAQKSVILDRYYDGDISKVPVVEYIGSYFQPAPLPCSVPCEDFAGGRTYYLPTDELQLPSVDSWAIELSGPHRSWVSALLTSEVVVQGSKRIWNPVHRIMRARPGQVITVSMTLSGIAKLSICSRESAQPDVEMRIDTANIITVCIYHAVNGDMHPWELRFKYCPSMPSALIHEIGDGLDRGYIELLVSGSASHSMGSMADHISSLPILGTPIHRAGYVITDELVARYCKSVRNGLAHYRPQCGRSMLAPADLLFVIATNGLFALLDTPQTAGGVMSMVHMANRYTLEADFDQLQVGDSIDHDVFIREMRNTLAGKQMEVAADFYKGGMKIASMDISLLFRGVESDVEATFKHVNEPKYLVDIKSQSDITALCLKDWILFRDGYPSEIAPGSTLEFEVSSKYRYKSPALYSHVRSTGHVYLVNKSRPKLKVCVADIDFEWCETLTNPVVAFLETVGYLTDEVSLFEHEGIPVVPPGNDGRLLAVAPESASEYAEASGDRNPIHTNVYIADYACLPCPIIHGMWTSASTRAHIERYAANCQPERIRAYSTEFVDMVLPGDQLETKLFHVGMKNGRMLVKGETKNQHGSVVLTCAAEVDQPKTVYTFAGLGSQQVGMGMDMCAKSDSARSIWDRAEKHMILKYGVSLLNIIRNNPKQVTVKFGGKQGMLKRQAYMSLVTASADCQGNENTVSLFPHITDKTYSYTHQSESGLLNAAQFTQPALTVFAIAHMAHLKSQSLVQERAMFAGHSLGEFGALASLTSIFSVEDVVDITFYRGMLLHASIERDGQNRSHYGMASVNPSRVSQGFSQDSLLFVINTIRTKGGALLELINYNVAGQQYVVTGHHSMLSTLCEVLDTIHACNIDVSSSDGKEIASKIIGDILMQPDRDITPKRGHSFIPLPGVDVPSHSTQLLPAVAPFRKYLLGKIPEYAVDFQELKGIYIPNVTAKPFAVTKDYFLRAFEATKSSVIEANLATWTGNKDISDVEYARLAHVLLIELLAYQFASPVRWIETQDELVSRNAIRRFIEISPTPILSGISATALRLQRFGKTKISVLHATRDENGVCYSYTPQLPAVDSTVSDVDAAADTQKQSVAPKPDTPASTTVATTSTFTAEELADKPIKTSDIIQALVALNLKMSIDNVNMSMTIKELSGGKSTTQNEIISELQKEFGNSLPDKAEEMALGELSSRIGHSAEMLGKQSSEYLARMFATKLPGNFTQSTLCSHLKSAYGLGPKRQLGILLQALTLAPPNRLTTDAQVHEWIHGVAEMYATREKISYSTLHASNSTMSSAQTAVVINSAEFDRAQKEQREQILREIEVLARNAGVDLHEDSRLKAKEESEKLKLQTELDLVRSEMGEEYLNGIRPMFDARKARHYNSYWNWARQDLFEMVNRLILGECTVSTEELLMLKNRANKSLVDLAKGILSSMEQHNPRYPHVMEKLQEIIQQCEAAHDSAPVYSGFGQITQPLTEITWKGEVSNTEVPRHGEHTFVEYAANMQKLCSGGYPYLHTRSKQNSGTWVYDKDHSNVYFQAMSEAGSTGLTFEGKTVLIIGCGRGSIGSEILKGLLAGGAKVVATTSSYSHKTTMYFEGIYRQYGARGSELYLFPFNQASVTDVGGLVNHIFSEAGLGWDLDFIMPFASASDMGSELTSLKSHSELVLRTMMTNVMRLVGAIANAKVSHGLENAPSLVLVPLSPNHSLFGGDGFYGECKAGLETLLNRWGSETWSSSISIVGAIIGWTRGTNMMDAISILSSEVEKYGTRTFTANEMAFNILCLLHPDIHIHTADCPLLADISGGFQALSGNLDKVFAWRDELIQHSSNRKAVFGTVAHEYHSVSSDKMSEMFTHHTTDPLANNGIQFPQVKSYEQLEGLRHLEGMINLDKVVVVTGYGEYGPYGHSGTRWEMEAHGQFSNEGCIELAWIMGLIKHHNGPLPTDAQTYIGWVDVQTGKPIRDGDIRSAYKPYILKHTGIRVLEPATINDADPSKITVLREVQVTHDLEPFEATAEEAQQFKDRNGDNVDVWESSGGLWSVKFRKGAIISVQKYAPFNRTVVGQLPTGWDPRRYGIPDEIVNVADPITHYTIISTIEALLRSGITDPYELYEYFHLSEIGNSTGSCVGGGSAIKEVFSNFVLDKEVKTDALQEMLINTVAAWVNMLIFSSAGPIKATVGACGTVAMSLDVAIETIQSGKAKMMIAGAADSFDREAAMAMALIKATANAHEEQAAGRTLKEMSRPCTASRSGFVESNGAGIVTLMSASAAIACGAPIYGILAMSATATDKEGRTVPAPGQGILTAAREAPSRFPSPMLNFEYRHRQFEDRMSAISSWIQQQNDDLSNELNNVGAFLDSSPYVEKGELIRSRKELIDRKSLQMVKENQNQWFNEFWKDDPTISPLRGSLAAWGLDIDDVDMLSFHATSTVANDKNEPHVMDQQLKKLGRAPGYAVPAVCQKWLTGHPKGPAAAWMLNGVMQCMQTGIIPGNRNLDSVTPELEKYDHILFPSKSIQTPGIKAAILTTFGFGQVGGEILVLNPDFVHAVLPQDTLDQYRKRVKEREQRSNRYWQDVLVGNHSFVQVKDTPPFAPEQEAQVYMNPLARASYDPVSNSYHF